MTYAPYPAPVKKAKPTKKHRLAITPGILGTVYAVSPEGEARYFDYDLPGAYAWAGLTADSDLRYAIPPERAMYIRSGAFEANPNHRTRCIWVRP